MCLGRQLPVQFLEHGLVLNERLVVVDEKADYGGYGHHEGAKAAQEVEEEGTHPDGPREFGPLEQGQTEETVERVRDGGGRVLVVRLSDVLIALEELVVVRPEEAIVVHSLVALHIVAQHLGVGGRQILGVAVGHVVLQCLIFVVHVWVEA